MSQRREFLQSTAAAGGLLVLKPETVFGTQANSAVEVGIIGCGGRGNYTGAMFPEYAGARIVAVTDPFEDRISETVAKLKASSARTYKGLDGYKELIASKLDAVTIMSPPYFHPEQVEAAVAAGKHVFIAKPLAPDVAGCRRIRAASETAAQKKLSCWVDFQTRAQATFQEAAARVHRGEIGELVLGHVYYHASRLAIHRRPVANDQEFRLRNWVFDKIYSGDIIVEQNIHVLDVANWYLNAHPIRAAGTGGRKARVDVGDCWDHFLVTFWYPNDVRVDFSSAQFTRGYNDLCIRVYGSKGTVDSHYGGAVRITGDNPWTGTEKDDTGRGAIANVKQFVAGIRDGKPINNVDESLRSNLTAILGRMAAYGERIVTWEEMMQPA